MTYFQMGSKRIRVPLTPDILKSSRSWTTISLFGSLGSELRTYIEKETVFSKREKMEISQMVGEGIPAANIT